MKVAVQDKYQPDRNITRYIYAQILFAAGKSKSKPK